MKAIYLFLSIGTFTPDGQHTSREIFIPMPTEEVCAVVLSHTAKLHTIGKPADIMSCVYFKHDRRDE